MLSQLFKGLISSFQAIYHCFCGLASAQHRAWAIPVSAVGTAEAFPGGGKEPLSPWCVRPVLLPWSLPAKQVLQHGCPGCAEETTPQLTKVQACLVQGAAEELAGIVPGKQLCRWPGWAAALGAEAPPKEAVPGQALCKSCTEGLRRKLQASECSFLCLTAASEPGPVLCAGGVCRRPSAHGRCTSCGSRRRRLSGHPAPCRQGRLPP